jgi:pyrroloquinoline quinone biosynthesis protein B
MVLAFAAAPKAAVVVSAEVVRRGSVLLIKVLGAAAGGGFPQWNCNAATSRAAWSGVAGPGISGVTPCTQSSLAVSADGERWILLNASPDIRQQIAATAALHPRADGALRNSPIQAVVLTNADVDHVAGLLSLRERHPLTIYGSPRVLEVLAANSIFNVLHPDYVSRQPLNLGQPNVISHRGLDLGVTIEPFSVPGKIALYLEDAAAGPGLGTRDGDTIGLKITGTATGRAFYYLPACAAVDADLQARLAGAVLVFFDGTLFTDDELVRQSLSDKTGARMGHLSMSGPGGSMAAFADLNVKRRIFIHINTSNPAWIAGTPERRQVEAAGWEIALDGMEVEL